MLRNAYTLLEVILALALAAIVLAILGMAVDTHLTAADAGRTEVEQAQLARALLHRIAEDLRATIPYSEPESSSSETSIASPKEIGGSTSTGESGSDTTQQPSSGLTTPQFSGGFHGTLNELQFDFCRLPRPGQATAAGNGAAVITGDRISDARTVIYGMIQPDDFLTNSPESDSGNVHGGLVRRELDAASFALATEQGESLDVAAEVLAPEVVKIEFEYFDGTMMQSEWDSELQGGLPAAVRAIVYLRRPQRRRAIISLSPLEEPSELIAYSLLVELPNAQTGEGSMGSGQGSTASDSAGTEGSSQGSSGSSSGSGGTTSGSGTTSGTATKGSR